mmetsp:Transcript_4984/g.9916  ORF Transcript_4984/g.9916 Transcript_4984/m.9916 type:complete len:299 (+) Transcript_4984:174-1070(+)
MKRVRTAKGPPCGMETIKETDSLKTSLQFLERMNQADLGNSPDHSLIQDVGIVLTSDEVLHNRGERTEKQKKGRRDLLKRCQEYLWSMEKRSEREDEQEFRAYFNSRVAPTRRNLVLAALVFRFGQFFREHFSTDEEGKHKILTAFLPGLACIVVMYISLRAHIEKPWTWRLAFWLLTPASLYVCVGRRVPEIHWLIAVIIRGMGGSTIVSFEEVVLNSAIFATAVLTNLVVLCWSDAQAVTDREQLYAVFEVACTSSLLAIGTFFLIFHGSAMWFRYQRSRWRRHKKEIIAAEPLVG